MAAVYHGVLCTVSDKWCASHTAHATANMMCTHGSAVQQARPSMCLAFPLQLQQEEPLLSTLNHPWLTSPVIHPLP